MRLRGGAFFRSGVGMDMRGVMALVDLMAWLGWAPDPSVQDMAGLSTFFMLATAGDLGQRTAHDGTSKSEDLREREQNQ